MQGKCWLFYQKIGMGLIIASFGMGSSAMAQWRIAPKGNVVQQTVIVPASANAMTSTTVPQGTSVPVAAVVPVSPKPQIPRMAKTQTPGFYRVMLGKFEVTALFDGVFEFHPELLKNANKQDIERVLAHHFGKVSDIQTAVNAYLVNTGEHLILIDAGTGQLFSKDKQGHIIDNLKASGYQPEQVDKIIMTHLHGDHAGGLSNMEGRVLFPNATVYANKAENEYWLSEKLAATAPVDRQIFFKMARDSAVPYLSTEKWKNIEAGQELVPGIKAIAAYGHTPGHTVFMLESDGQQLLIAGDIIHSHAIQFKRPDVAIEYDSDPALAVRIRQNILRYVAEKGVLMAGMHLPFPGLGHVRSEGSNQYSWVPVEYTPLN